LRLPRPAMAANSNRSIAATVEAIDLRIPKTSSLNSCGAPFGDARLTPNHGPNPMELSG
jgi:hypothetical protein